MFSSASAAQHNQVMATLQSIQATQKDILDRIERLEQGPAVGPNTSTSADLPASQETQLSHAGQGRSQSEKKEQERANIQTVPASPVHKRQRLMTSEESRVQRKWRVTVDVLMQIKSQNDGACWYAST